MKESDRIKRFNQAERESGYKNCAGFVAFILRLTKHESYMDPNSKINGLPSHLDAHDALPVAEFTPDAYVTKAGKSDSVAIIGKNRHGTDEYLHHFVPHPEDASKVLHRNGFEEAEPRIESIQDVLNDSEYEEARFLVFFKVRRKKK